MPAANQNRNAITVFVAVFLELVKEIFRLSYCLVLMLFSFTHYFLIALQSDNNSKTVYVLEHK